MSEVKILVVEDELVIADHICQVLESLGYQVPEPAINYEEAVESLETDLPDLAILDIQLAGKRDGIELADTINKNFQIPFIFLTSNADRKTVERAKKVEPNAYLVKPFRKEGLYTAIETALYNFSGKQNDDEGLLINDAIFVKEKDTYQKISFKNIKYLKSEHVYVELCTMTGQNYLIRSSLKNLSEKMPSNFYQVHRSYAVNFDLIDAINGNFALVAKEKIPIGKNYRQHVMKRVGIA